MNTLPKTRGERSIFVVVAFPILFITNFDPPEKKYFDIFIIVLKFQQKKIFEKKNAIPLQHTRKNTSNLKYEVWTLRRAANEKKIAIQKLNLVPGLTAETFSTHSWGEANFWQVSRKYKSTVCPTSPALFLQPRICLQMSKRSCPFLYWEMLKKCNILGHPVF